MDIEAEGRQAKQSKPINPAVCNSRNGRVKVDVGDVNTYLPYLTYLPTYVSVINLFENLQKWLTLTLHHTPHSTLHTNTYTSESELE